MIINNFTVLRLVLATLVIFGHFKTLAGLSNAGGIYGYVDLAVNAFFIVSGYLVYGSFDNSPKVGGFYIKRFFRIYPLYAFMIIAQMVAMFILLKGNVGLAEMLKYLISNLAFANFISPDMGGLLADAHNPAINASLWTLKIEVMFYAIVPVLWLLVQRVGLKILPAIYIASVLFAALAIHYGHESWTKQLPGQLRFFVVGFLLYHYRDKFRFSLPVAVFLALICFIISSMRKDLFPEYIALLVEPIIIGAWVFICALRLPVLNLKYDISYGVYLIHAPLIQISLLLGIYEDDTGFLALLVGVVYILAFLAEKLIEIPMVKLGKKLSTRASGKIAAVETEKLEVEKI